MPPINVIGSLQPAADAGHSGHAGNVATGTEGSSGASFAATLAQAISQSPGGGAHASHGDGIGGNAAGTTAASSHQGHGTASSLTSGDTHPGHILIGGANHGEGHGLQAAAMGVRVYRQQLIASNIANADTPGYKAVDIDLQEALRIAQAAQAPPVSLATTSTGHLFGQAHSSMPLYPLKYQVPSQPSADGNTVDMDVERSKLAENSLMYQFSMDRVSGHFKMMMELFQSMKP